MEVAIITLTAADVGSVEALRKRIEPTLPTAMKVRQNAVVVGCWCKVDRIRYCVAGIGAI